MAQTQFLPGILQGILALAGETVMLNYSMLEMKVVRRLLQIEESHHEVGLAE